MFDFIDLVRSGLSLLNSISLFKSSQSLLKLKQLYECSSFFLYSFDIMWIKVYWLITLANAFLEIFHVKITESPIKVKCWIFGMNLNGFAIKVKCFFVIAWLVGMISLLFELICRSLWTHVT